MFLYSLKIYTKDMSIRGPINSIIKTVRYSEQPQMQN